jgi:hypothetical protein
MNEVLKKNIASHCWIWPLIRKCLRVVGLLKVLMFHSYLSLPYSLPMDSMCEVPCQPWWRVFVVMKRQAMGDSQQKLVQKQVRSKVYIVYYIYIYYTVYQSQYWCNNSPENHEHLCMGVNIISDGLYNR